MALLCIFVCLPFATVRGSCVVALGSHTPCVVSSHFRLSQAGCTMDVCVLYITVVSGGHSCLHVSYSAVLFLCWDTKWPTNKCTVIAEIVVEGTMGQQ